MDFFERVGDTIVQVGKDVTQKAKDVSGMAKLKMDIRAKKESVKESYLELGKIAYQRHKGETAEETALFERIDEALEEIEKMELQILELKGARMCPECGAQASDTAEYCSACGAKLAVVVADASDDKTAHFDFPEEETGGSDE